MKLHVFPPSPNAIKTIAVNALTGAGAEIAIVDITKGEQHAPEFVALNPNTKMPVLEFDDGSSLWESNAITNKIASMTKSDLWPANDSRYDIMRWQFWETAHWNPALTPYLAKTFFGQDPDLDAAGEVLHRFATVLDGQLAGSGWLVGEAMTTADISIAAPMVHRHACAYPLDEFPRIAAWIARIEALPGWQAVMPQRDAA